MSLTQEQKKRYKRNTMLPIVGVKGQEKLLTSKVLLVGAGGLGSPAGLYLTAAGIGTLGVMDGDTVDLSNLQRQILYKTKDIGQSKALIATQCFQALNPDTTINTYHQRLTTTNAHDIIKDYHFVLDCTDNFASKFLIADTCHQTNTPYSHAGISQCTGQLMTVLPGQTACFRCLFHAPPPEELVPPPSTTGVMGVLPGVIGSLQATEALKFLLGAGDLLTNTLMTYDALTMNIRRMKLNPNPACPLCGSFALPTPDEGLSP